MIIPPNPHLVPWGDGLTKSANPTLAPSATAALAHAKPPEPPPITKKSKLDSYSICIDFENIISRIFLIHKNTKILLDLQRNDTNI